MFGVKKLIRKFLKKYRLSKILSSIKSEHKQLINEIRNKNLTYLPPEKLVSIISTIENIESNEISGIFIEAGCALGGSSILVSKLKPNNRKFFIYDVFDLIPPPSQEDPSEVHERYNVILQGKSQGIGSDKYYGYQKNLYEIVLQNLESFGINCKSQSVELIKGLVQNTMKIQQPIAFAHIDVDWYEPVKHCLEQICPNLSIGGSVILDDYYDWGGCRKATDEFLRKFIGQFSMNGSMGSMKLTRIK